IQCLSIGTLSDIYSATERGNAIGIFYLGFFIGPVIGPPIGGFLTQYISWRSLFWFIATFATIRLLLLFIFLPETYFYRNNSITNPSKPAFNLLAPILLLRHTNVTLLWVVLPVERSQIYYSTGILKNVDNYFPELRLHGAWWGASLIPLSYFCFGWFLEYKVYVVYPVIAMLIGTFMSQIATNSCETYLIDSYPESSASIVALSTVCKCIVAPSMLVAAAPIDHSVGAGLTFTILTL
ncbi:15359_t:CDS:2, partial [Funneliformis geosporum]